MRRIILLSAALLLVAAGCGGGDDVGAPDTTASGVTTPPETTPVLLPGGELQPCESPEGFTISAPTGWSTNPGEVVARCTQFHREPFEVPRGTDERVAAIAVHTERVDYATAAAPVEGVDEDRAVTAVDGRRAVRLSYESSGRGLYPEGTPITRYVVDLTAEGGPPTTLLADTLGTPQFDYEANVVILDRMVRTIEVTAAGVDTDPALVATYLGGGGGFSVAAAATGGQVCLRIPPNGEPVCTDRPAADQAHTISLTDLRAGVPAGVTGEDVWRVDLVTAVEGTHSYLPAPVPGTELGAYAFPDTVEGFERLVLYDVTGERLRVIEPGAA